MLRGKDIGNGLREAITVSHQSEKYSEKDFKQIKKAFKAIANVPRSGRPSTFTPRSDIILEMTPLNQSNVVKKNESKFLCDNVRQ